MVLLMVVAMMLTAEMGIMTMVMMAATGDDVCGDGKVGCCGVTTRDGGVRVCGVDLACFVYFNLAD